MAETLQSSQFTCLIGKQSSKGTAAATYKAYRWVSGELTVDKESDSQNYGDGKRFGNPFLYIKKITGSGSLGFQAGPDTIARLVSYTLGTDSVTGSAVPYTHELTPNDTAGPWLTVITAVGEGSNAIIFKNVDCKISQLEIESSAGDSVVNATAEINSLQPGIKLDTLPSYTEVEEPFVHTDQCGAFTIGSLNGGDPLGALSQWKATISLDMETYFGTCVTPYALVEGRGSITLEGTLLADDVTIPLIYSVLYDDATPASGTAPTATLFEDGITLTLSNGLTGTDERSASLEFQSVNLVVDKMPEVQADGGASEIGFAGIARDPVSGDQLTVTALTADSAAY